MVTVAESLMYMLKINNFLGFAEVPSSEVIEVGGLPQAAAVFRCRHTSVETFIFWRVNGSAVGLLPDITTGSISENGAVVYTLTIPARSEYNGTEVVCVAAFLDGSPTESTPPATLQIITG